MEVNVASTPQRDILLGRYLQSLVHASREVILTAGAVNSPKLLLLSGIGPAKDLEALRIPVIQDLPGVGKNLQDRLYLPLVKVQEPESHHRSTYIDSPASFMKAREAWITSQSGPLSDFYLPQMIGYLKLDTIITSQEFHDLESKTKEFLKAETKPHYEIFSVSGLALPLHLSFGQLRDGLP